MVEAYEAIISGVTDEEFHSATNGSDEGAHERLAVARATKSLVSHVSDAEIWRADVYDNGLGVGLSFDTEQIDDTEVLFEEMDNLEMIDCLGVEFEAEA